MRRCEPDAQQMIANLTFEDLITNERGIAVSRALVNVVINQQIGQQISVSRPEIVVEQYRILTVR